MDKFDFSASLPSTSYSTGVRLSSRIYSVPVRAKHAELRANKHLLSIPSWGDFSSFSLLLVDADEPSLTQLEPGTSFSSNFFTRNPALHRIEPRRRALRRSPSNVALVPALRRTVIGHFTLPFALGGLRTLMSLLGKTVSIVTAHRTPILVGSFAVTAVGIGRIFIRRGPAVSPTTNAHSPVENLEAFVLSPGSAAQVTLCTYNLRGIMDRYEERVPLLRAELAEIDADLFAFQEVLTGEFAQERHLLGEDYSVFGCRAALANMDESGGAMSVVARTFHTLLSLGASRPLLLKLPGWAQAFAEACNMYNAGILNLRNACMAPFFGNSIAARLPTRLATRHEILTLQDFRAAQRVLLWLPALTPRTSPADGLTTDRGERISGAVAATVQSGVSGSSGAVMGEGTRDTQAEVMMEDGGVLAYTRGGYHTVPSITAMPRGNAPGGAWASAVERTRRREGLVPVWVVNTHLAHDCPGARARQAEAILAWMRPVTDQAAAVVVLGDLNAPPDEPLHRIFAQAGFQSAFRAVHGREPAATWPTGIVAPLMDHGEAHCADYIYVQAARGVRMQLASAEVRGAEPAADDKTLYPSDHVAIRTVLRISAEGGLGAGAMAEADWARAAEAMRTHAMVTAGEGQGHRPPFANAKRRGAGSGASPSRSSMRGGSEEAV